MRILIFSFLIVVCQVRSLVAQELFLDVQVTYPALATADPKTLQELEKSIREFYNNTQWTDERFETEERIEGSIQINVKSDPTANSFIADIYVSAGRPVYMSNYTSPILNHIDKNVSFNYETQTVLRNNRTGFSDNLSAILSYYAYVILGYDFDTFSPLGGEPYFKIAQQIISTIPANVSARDVSWTNKRSHSRFLLIENILNPRVTKMRQALYSYHRNGMDKLTDDVGISKAVILTSLKQIGQVSDAYRNAMVIQMFANAKTPEILEIFKNSVKSEQRQVYKIMTTMDPSKVDDLRALR